MKRGRKKTGPGKAGTGFNDTSLERGFFNSILTMSFYNRFSSLAKQLVSLLDAGKKLDIDETHQHIRNGTLFSWLEEKFPDRVDMSQHHESDLLFMQQQFALWSKVVDERRKLEIKHNGICLLIAYCIEAVEADPDVIQDKS